MRFLPLAIAVPCLALAACNWSSSDPTATPTVTERPSGAPSATPATSPTPTPDAGAEFPELTPFPPDLLATLHEIRDRVAAIRGLPVHPTAEEGLVSTEALQQYGRDQFSLLDEDDQLDVATSEAMFSLMGLVPPGFTFEDFASDSAELYEGVYYFEADRLVLVGDELPQTLSVREELVLAHEYVHSMQDAEFDLGEFLDSWLETSEEEDGYTSYSETLRCLIEGDAEVTKALYAESVYGSGWESLLAAEYSDDDLAIFDEIPEFLLNALYFDYTDCVAFVQALYDDGGWDAVNAAYFDPPGTTEQILLIDKYYDGEVAGQPRPDDIDDQVPGWSEAFGGQWGLFDTFNYIGSLTGDYFSGYLAADGWDYGWIRAFRSDDEPPSIAVDVTLGWDSTIDRDEFMSAFEGVLNSHGVGSGDVSVVGDVHRWQASDDSGHHGALTLYSTRPALRLVFAPDAAIAGLFIEAQ